MRRFTIEYGNVELGLNTLNRINDQISVMLENTVNREVVRVSPAISMHDINDELERVFGLTGHLMESVNLKSGEKTKLIHVFVK